MSRNIIVMIFSLITFLVPLYAENYSKMKVIFPGKVEYDVDVADTKSTQVLGLSGREILNPNTGMLFVYPNKAVKNFWMRGMRIPIDIIWLNDNRVVNISPNLPTPRKYMRDFELPLYGSIYPVNYILEVNAGDTKKYQINIDDVVEYKQSE